MGRLAQWESACLTRKRALVQTQRRPPIAAPSSSGLGRSPLQAEIAGSNPAGATSFGVSDFPRAPAVAGLGAAPGPRAPALAALEGLSNPAVDGYRRELG